MIDLMQAVEFVRVGKLYMIKDGDGTRYTEEQVKEMMRKNTKELNQEIKEDKKEEKPRKKKVVKDDIVEETSQAD